MPSSAGSSALADASQPGRRSSQGSRIHRQQHGTVFPIDGPLSSPAAPFTVSNDFDPNPDIATFQYVAPPTDVLATSLTTDQSVYQLGQPIQLTFTETNVGTTPVQVLEGPSSFDVTAKRQPGLELAVPRPLS